MLSRSVFISLTTIKPVTFNDHINLTEFLETSVCYQIYKAVTNTFYYHLPVTYKYSKYKIDNLNTSSNLVNSIINSVTTTHLNPDNDKEFFSINNFISKTVEEALEEFNIVYKTNNNFILNFNSCLINKNNFVLSIEVLPRS